MPLPRIGRVDVLSDDIVSQFMARCNRHPEATAIEYQTQSVNYRQLREMIEEYASRFVSGGLKPNARVAIFLNRTPDAIAAMLGVLRAGGVYIPLDPLAPAARNQLILDDACPMFIVTSSELARSLPKTDATILTERRTAQERDIDSISGHTFGSGQCYIQYTSGSTGIPKGVVVLERSVTRLFEWLHGCVDFAAGKSFLATTTFTFDISALELLFPLLYGGRVLLADDAETRDSQLLCRTLIEKRPDYIQATPTGYRMLLGADWPGDPELTLLCGGEALDSALADELLKRGRALWNLYGPTETTIWSMASRIDLSSKMVTIGRPIPGTRVYVLNSAMRPVPVGVAGELYIGGDGVALGYLNRPAATARQFVPNPFSGIPGARQFKTGDRVHWLADRQLKFIGRLDSQLKIRGFRIEVGEVEHAIGQHPSVAQCAVAPVGQDGQLTHLAAYLVPKSGHELRAHEIADFVKTLVPGYMLPARWVVLDELPISTAGKVDRKSLPRIESTSVLRSASRYVAPQSELQSQLVAIWQQVLEIEPIGIEDNFFLIGGSSLSAARILSRVRNQMQCEFPLSQLLDEPTIAKLARLIEETGSNEAARLPEIPSVDRSGRLPLSFAQERLWFLCQLTPDNPFYNVPVAVRVTGALDYQALSQALHAVFQRHEALRTSFSQSQGRPFQRIHSDLTIELSTSDLTQLSPSEQDDQITYHTIEEATKPFELPSAPLARARLFKLNAQEHVFLLTVHHIVTDGWSMRIMATELAMFYMAASEAKPVELPPLTVQYADYAAWEREAMERDGFQEQLRKWTSRLDKMPMLQLPFDKPRPTVMTFRGDRIVQRCSVELSESIRQFCASRSLTPQMLFLASFKSLLHRYTGQTDLVVGMPTANRNRPEIEALVGFFVNTLAIRTRIEGDDSFNDVLRAIRQNVLEALAEQSMPFERIVEALHPERSLSHNPLVQVMLAVEEVREPGIKNRELSFQLLDPPVRATRFDLEIHIWDTNAGFSIEVYFSSDLFEKETVRRLVEQWTRLLDAALADPDCLIRRLPLTTSEEVNELREKWVGEAIAVPTQSLLDRFESMVSTAPTLAAVRDETNSIDYLNLNLCAERIAAEICHRADVQGKPIAIFFERSIEWVIAQVAVLKAQGGFLSLDPAWPRARLESAIIESGTPVILTTSALAQRIPEGYSTILIDEPHIMPGGPVQFQRPVSADAPLAERIAYYIFTSGSTGGSKAVCARESALINLLDHLQSIVPIAPGNQCSVWTSVGFDVAIYEVFSALCYGATLNLVPDTIRSDGVELGKWLRDRSIHSAYLPPFALGDFATWLESSDNALPLRRLLVGVEPIRESLLARIEERIPELQIINGYGPSEASVCSTFFIPGKFQRCDNPAPIGLPLPGVRLQLLDAHLESVPIGFVGELYIAGSGLGKGYLHRPRLTAQRFIPALGPLPGSVAFKSGDLVRSRYDGQLEFVGRADTQVKISGARVEPGEVESVLLNCGAISEVAVVSQLASDSQLRLTAFVVPRKNSVLSSTEGWRDMFAETYASDSAHEDPRFNIVGWNSAINDRPISADIMRELVQGTVQRIRSLGPGRVLEIGVGTGLVMHSLAPSAHDYWATDFSPEALRLVSEHLQHLDPKPTLRCQQAIDFSGLPRGAFNTVVINSVVQYFPDEEYLFNVLQWAIESAANGGRIFIGDVRSLALLPLLHYSIAQFRAEGENASQLRARVRDSIEWEEELIIDPRYFQQLPHRLPRISRVLVEPKRGHDHNELTRYRYDVVLELDGPIQVPTHVETQSWQAGMTLDSLRTWLQEQSPGAAVVTNIPNARTASIAQEYVCAGGAERDFIDMSSTERESIDPEELWQLSESIPYHVYLDWSNGDASGAFHACFTRRDETACPIPSLAFDIPNVEQLINSPKLAVARRTLLPQLRAHVDQHLPTHMRPSAYGVLSSLPRTASGKVDRLALAKRHVSGWKSRTKDEPPRSDMEREIAATWSAVLGVQVDCRSDNFFELGGHSLTAAQVIARLRQRFSVHLPLARVFEKPVLADFAEMLSLTLSTRSEEDVETFSVGSDSARVLDGPTMASVAQEQLWFLQQMDPGSTAYHMPASCWIEGPLNPDALQAAYIDLQRRHAALRTVFSATQFGIEQIVDAQSPVALEYVDLSELEVPEAKSRALALAAQMTIRPFDLKHGPLHRANVFRIADGVHLCVICVHHIIADGWSAAVAARDLLELYLARLESRPVFLPALPTSYAVLSTLHRQRVESGELDQQEQYWRQQLSDAPQLLELTTDHLSAQEGAVPADRLPVHISAKLTGRLRALATRKSASLFMMISAAIQCMLSRLSGQQIVCLGVPVSGRSEPRSENIVGLFANLLVLKADLATASTFDVLLSQVCATTLEAFANQELPFERVVRAIQPVRHAGRQPLVQAVLSMQNFPQASVDFGNLKLTPVELPITSAKFDLTFSIGEQQEELVGWLEYRTDLFEESTGQRLINGLMSVLEAVAANPTIRIVDIPLGAASSRSALPAPTFRECRIEQLFDEQVKRSPHAVAVAQHQVTWSYSQLHQRAGQYASQLRRRGVHPGDHVAILMRRSPDMIAALVGILQSGCAYVPLEPSHPEDYLKNQIEDAQVSYALVDAIYASLLPSGVQRIDLSEMDGDGSSNTFDDVEYDAANGSSRSTAYIMYTSGSTGQPKAVAIPHRAVIRLVTGCHYSPINSHDVVLGMAPTGFDASTFEIWAALLHGARLELLPADELVSATAIARTLEEQKVTTLWLTAGLFHELVQHDPIPFQSVRQLLTGGDVVLPEDVARVFDRTMIERVVNGYGPTENTTFTCCHIMHSPPSVGSRVPIGEPIPGTTVHVVDRLMRICPVGVAGELCAGGDGLALGYYGRPRMTATQFIPDPFAELPGQRMYRTGDRVRMRDDGLIDFLGRLDRQLKVRGFRVEPAAVEAVLLSHPEVTSAAVFDEGQASQRQLVAAVVANGRESSVDLIREYLASKLPSYSIPTRWMTVEQLPLTVHGKVDRRALVASLGLRPTLNEQYVAPRNAREELLAQMLAQLLQLDRVGIHDNFFDIGGHSLLATRVLLRLRQLFNVDLPLRELFAEPTVAGLCRLIEQAETATAAMKIPVVSRSSGLPLSPAQDRIWFLQQLAPQSAFFNIPLSIRIVGQVDIERLCEAARALITRHEALRTQFEDHHGTPLQHIRPDWIFEPQVIDLQSHPEGRAEASQIQLRSARRPFHLGTEIPIRFTLIQIDDSETWALLNFHHIAVDGWSLWILLSELHTLVEFQDRGGDAQYQLAPLPAQYADFAVWQREQMNSPSLAAQLEYWRGQLAGAPRVLRLPTDYPPPAVQRFVGDQYLFSIPEATWANVVDLARVEGTTTYVVALAAYQALLHRHTGQDDICVGVAVAGRTHPATESMVGCLANTLVLRSRMPGDRSFKDHLRMAHQTVLDAHANQDLAFATLLQELQPDRDVSTTPLFQVMFGLERAPINLAAHQSLRYELLSTPTGTVKCDLSLLLTEFEGRVSGVIEYRTDLFDRSTIVRLSERLITMLNGIADWQEHSLSRLPLLTEQDCERIQCFAEPTTHAYVGETVDQQFERQAGRTPHATALIHRDRQVSYDQLAVAVRSMSNNLSWRGVGRGDRVGVLLERGPEYVASVLAILRLGACVVPLKVDDPDTRIDSFLQSSKARWIVTEANRWSWLDAFEIIPPPAIPSSQEHNRSPELASHARLDDGAFLIYTSGSTGIPKGVLVTHRCITNRFQAEMIPPVENDVWAATTGLTAIDSIWELLMPLISGHRAVIMDSAVVRDPWALVDQLAAHRVTRTVMVPSLLRGVLEANPELAKRLPALRYWYLGGETLPVDLHNRFRDAYPGAVLINGYGLSETWDVTAYECVRQNLDDNVPVGTPFQNVSVLLLDPWLAIVPPGVAGEMYVGGDGLARCYYGQPRLTASRFVPNEHGPIGSRLFRTGDLGTIGHDGLLRHSGRVDQQIKIRGFKVDPGEVEAAIRGLDEVSHAVVTAKVVGNSIQLVAHVIVSKECVADGTAETQAKLGKELKRKLASRLPAYLVPRAVVVWDALPRLANGKLNRLELNACSIEMDNSQSPPETETEHALSALWGQLLQIGFVGRESDFFSLGGDSLTAMQLVARARDNFGVEISLIDLFAAPQLHQLAAVIDQRRHSGSLSRLPAVVSEQRPERIPLSPSQHRFWFLCHLLPVSPVFHLAAAIDLDGSIDITALQATFHEVVRRHESLRTRYVLDESGPRQDVMADWKTIDIQWIDWHDGTSLNDQLAADAIAPFDFAAAPPFRVRLYRLSEQSYVLLLVAHHMAIDGWSLGVFVNELAILYEAYRAQRPSPLPEPTLQYADYVLWQQRRLGHPDIGGQLTYWRERLRSAPVLELPTDRPRPAIMETAGATQMLAIDSQVWSRFKEVARALDVTPFAALMSAVQILLSRLARQTDICVGTPTAGRLRRELEPLIGLFVNTLTIRGDLSGNPTFDQLVRQIQTRVLEAFENQEVPFQRVVEELNPPRDLSRPPLFQVMLVLQNSPMPQVELPGTKMAFRHVDVRSSALDLTIYAVEGNHSGVTIGWEYRSTLFDPGTIRSMHRCLVALIESIIDEPRQPVSCLEWMESEEVAAVVDIGRGRWTDCSDVPCLHQLFTDQVDRTPDAIALLEGEQATTFSELDRLSNQLAHALIERGIRVGDRVGLCLHRSQQSIVAILATLKAGATYVPLSPADPDLRNESLLKDASVRLLLTHALTSDVAIGSVPRLDLDANSAWIAGQLATRPRTGVTARDAAYILFTSGTSGRPKGVVVPHRGASNRITWAMASPKTSLTTSDRVLLKTPYTFDVSVSEIFEALASGAALVVAKNNGERDPQYLAEVIEKEKITKLHFVPSMLNAFLGMGNRSCLKSVRRITCSGEVLLPDVASDCYANWDGQLQNLYGPTETSIEVTWYEVDVEDCTSTLPIGRPIANVDTYVLDQQLRPCPIGATGEIFIGGVALAIGYLGQPGLTAASFIPDPFSQVPGSRLYRSRDRGRYRADGQLECLGRTDRQTKIRGFRIELEEVESIVNMHPEVDGAAVVAETDSNGDSRLLAYVAGDVKREALQAFLSERLPPYMLPSLIYFVAELPLTSSGKIDRGQLTAPPISIDASPEDQPTTDAEHTAAAIWCEILELESARLSDNFFEVGGHSLSAYRLVAAIQQRLGLQISIPEFFLKPTLLGLSERISRAVPTRSDSIPPRHGHLPIPASLQQQQMLTIQELNPGGNSYNLAFTARIRGRIQIAAMRYALKELMKRHEVLRTRFYLADGKWHQQISEEDEPYFEIIMDKYSLSEEATARDFLRTQALTSFDLRRGPVFRVFLVTFSPEDFLISIVVHHAVVDDWSLEVIAHDLSILYPCALLGVPNPLDPLRIQYADYAAWQRARLTNEEFERQLAFWQTHLHGAPATINLHGQNRPHMPSMRSKVFQAMLEGVSPSAVNSIAAETGSSAFVVLMASFQALVGRYLGQEDFCIGTLLSGRQIAETQPLVGYFLTTQAWRANLHGHPTFIELVERCRQTSQHAHANSDIPYEALADRLNCQVSPGRPPFLDILLTMVPPSPKPVRIPGLEIQPESMELHQARLDLVVIVQPSEAGFRIRWEYRQDLYDDRRIERLHSSLEQLLSAALENPSTPVSRLPFLSASDRSRLSNAQRDASNAWPLAEPVHHQFDHWVRETPDAIAVSHGTSKWSYKELDQWSNRIANTLLCHGIKPGSRVAALLGCVPERVAVFLALLKIRAVYVPLEPAHPLERLHTIVSEVMPEIILSTRQSMELARAFERPCLGIDATEPGCDSFDRITDTDPSQDLAYVVYTSGSTGKPKGVVVGAANLTNLVAGIKERLPVRPQERIAAIAPSSFDASIWEMIVSITNGATLCVFSGDLPLGSSLSQFLDQQSISFCTLTPSALVSMAEDILPELRTIVVAGEACLPTTAQAWSKSRCIINAYGPTEATICATMGDEIQSSCFPIGRANPGQSVYVLDRNLEPMPIDAEGELVIGGRGVAQGYWKHARLTALCFLPDPYSEVPGSRMYRTGDRARWMDDGNLQFIDRIDRQVKIRGVRIEPAEIEAALQRHIAVQSALVIALAHSNVAERTLAAYVRIVPQHEVSTAELRAHLAGILPSQSIPSHIQIVDEFPLTDHGKIDRVHFSTNIYNSLTPEEPPQGDTETRLARIWSEVLSQRNCGRNENFFDVGGHSLSAAQLLTLVATEFELSISFSQLITHPTIADFSRLIENSERSLDRRVVQLSAAGTASGALVLVHPAGGSLACYRELVNALASEHTIYGVQAFVTDASSLELTEVVNQVADELQSVHPVGPLYLCGWSTGGIFAHAVAAQWIQRGGSVPWLGMIDTRPTHDLPTGETQRPVQCAAYVSGLLEMSVGLSQDISSMMQLPATEQLELLRDRLHKRMSCVPSLQDLQQRFALFAQHVDAVAGYRPSVSVPRIDIVRTDPYAIDWLEQYGLQVTATDLDGGHYGVIRSPRVAKLATLFKQRMSDFQQ